MLLNPNDLKTLHVSQKDTLLNVHMIRVYSYPLHLRIKLKEGPAELVSCLLFEVKFLYEHFTWGVSW